jgi:hypothetical protein
MIWFYQVYWDLIQLRLKFKIKGLLKSSQQMIYRVLWLKAIKRRKKIGQQENFWNIHFHKFWMRKIFKLSWKINKLNGIPISQKETDLLNSNLLIKKEKKFSKPALKFTESPPLILPKSFLTKFFSGTNK